jgi:Amt family ammonium transporter
MAILAAAAQVDTGDTAWMLVATALVLMMTPALGLFYAGLVRSKNTLNTFMMCIAAIAVAMVTWALVGYSLAFDGDGSLIGGLGYAGLHGVGFAPREGGTIPHLVFMAFQATFCIITTALVSGAVVERMRFGAFLVFATLWSVLVYAVLAHWAFGGGWLAAGGTLDFAGGVPVEMGSGFSALAAALVVGTRKETTGAWRCCPTTRSTCCSGPACSGSAGSASTAAAASPPATPACSPSPTRC